MEVPALQGGAGTTDNQEVWGQLWRELAPHLFVVCPVGPRPSCPPAPSPGRSAQPMGDK